ncbi:MAG: NfeD family protein [Planctomycetota bacterium]
MSDDTLMLIGFGLLAASVVVMVFEMVIISAGVLTLFAIALAGGGIFAFFQVDALWGWSAVLFSLVMFPAFLVFFFKVMPHTAIGRGLYLDDDPEDVQRREREEAEEQAEIASMVGKEGVALTDMTPAGRIEVEGERFDAVAVGSMVDHGERVRVIGGWGHELKVRKA